MTSNRVLSHFSKLAEDGVWASLYSADQKVDSETWSFLIRARRVAELLQLSGTSLREVVDVGCGTAPIARSVAAMGARYVGLDFSAEMVESAQAGVSDLVDAGRAEFRVSDVTAIALPNQMSDAVVAMGVLEYLTRESVEQALSEVCRILRPNGVSILTIPKRHHWGDLVSTLFGPLRRFGGRAAGANLKLNQAEEFTRLYLTPHELDAACRRAGLRKVADRHYNMQPFARPVAARAPRFFYFLNRPFEGFASLPGALFFATGYIGMYRRDQ